MDGVDAALIETDGLGVLNTLDHISCPYDMSAQYLFKAAEYAVRRHCGDIVAVKQHFEQDVYTYCGVDLRLDEESIEERCAQLKMYLYAKNKKTLVFDDVVALSTKVHGDAVLRLLEKLEYDAQDIDVVGYHGQTLFHRPEQGTSVIVGDGDILAHRLKIPVVYNFRAADIAAGGVGAPFAPLYHQALAVRDSVHPISVVNCGGISNVTVISGDDPLTLIAFDTGPGNALIDRLVRERTQGQESMDKDGQYGLQGKVHENIVEELFHTAVRKNKENYFDMPPPKCLDIGDIKLIPALDVLSLEDAAATLEAFTAEAIVRSLEFVSAPLPDTWVTSGGGWNNPKIYNEFVTRLTAKLGPEITIQTVDAIGWRTQALEAEIFAFLAVRHLSGFPASVPGTTGVLMPTVGGVLCMPDLDHRGGESRRSAHG